MSDSDFHSGIVIGLVLGILMMLAVTIYLFVSSPYPVIFTGNVAAAPSASVSGGNENILITLSNNPNPNTVINCKVNLGDTSGPTQAYDLMTLTVGQHISLMQYSGNCTLVQ